MPRPPCPRRRSPLWRLSSIGQLIDGALARHTGIAQALDLGASVVYILPTGAACALPRAPRTATGVALHALTLLIEQRLMHEMAALQAATTIRLLPPLCPLAVSAADFGHVTQSTRAQATSPGTAQGAAHAQ